MTHQVDIAVRGGGMGTYTAAAKGVRASCTAGAKQCAERFGEKMFGPAFQRADLVDAPTDHTAPQRWRIHADGFELAWCWRSGLIEFGAVEPGGGQIALVFATGPRRALEQVVGVLARQGQGKSAGKLLAPGVPEAEDDNAACDALLAWMKWCAQRNGKPELLGVVFGNEKTRVRGYAA